MTRKRLLFPLLALSVLLKSSKLYKLDTVCKASDSEVGSILIHIFSFRDMRIPVDRKRDPMTGEFYDTFEGHLFKDGYLIKNVSTKTVTAQNIEPSFDELQKFQKPGDEKSSDAVGLASLLANRKKGHFMKGDAVVVIEGDLKNLMGIVEKVDEDSVFVKPKYKNLKVCTAGLCFIELVMVLACFGFDVLFLQVQAPLTFKDKQLCKFFKTGDHVKVVSGKHEGTTGMVVKVETHILVILSDTTKEDVSALAIRNPLLTCNVHSDGILVLFLFVKGIFEGLTRMIYIIKHARFLKLEKFVGEALCFVTEFPN